METLSKEDLQVEEVFYDESMDRLSQLPNDILIHILAFLAMEEAYKTSLVSKSWRLHWLNAHPNFDFNTSALIKPHDLDPLSISLDKNALVKKFFKRVNKVMRGCDPVKDATVQLNKLRIQFPFQLNEHYLKQIDEWISYAFARKVRSLELDFLAYSDTRYVTNFHESGRLLGSGTKIDLSCLRSLNLSGISVTKEDIESILCKCHFLQHLKVWRSLALTSVEICSSFVALKHLELMYCDTLRYVSVRDSSLCSLTVNRVRKLVLENNPNLVSVYVSYWQGGSKSTLQTLSNYLSRLQILTLSLAFDHDNVLDHVPRLSELKQLTLIVSPLYKEASIRLTTILKLSPNLEKLVLDLVRKKFEGKIEYEKGPKAHLQHLKDVEVHGYCGEEAEDEFFRCVLEYVVGPIENIIFDPYNMRCENYIPKKKWEIKSVETRAELLKRMIPSSSSIELVVL